MLSRRNERSINMSFLANVLLLLITGSFLGASRTQTGKVEPTITKNISSVMSDQGIDEGNHTFESECNVIVQFKDNYAVKHKYYQEPDKFVNHYSILNSAFLNKVKPHDCRNIYPSKLGPFIQLTYDDYDSFLRHDYYSLLHERDFEITNISIEEQVSTFCDDATRNKEKYVPPVYNISDAFADIGIPTNKTYTGMGIKIGSLEKGIPDSYVNFNSGMYFTVGTNRTSHATWTASIYGGKYGVANNSKMYFYQTSSASSIIPNIESLIVNDGVNIINQSSGVDSDKGKYDTISFYVDYVISTTGITYVCSAGNGSKAGYITKPALAVNAFAVVSNDKDKNISEFSSKKTSNQSYSRVKPTLSAPGDMISGIPNISKPISGTSLAAPFVTGISALLMEEFPDLKTNPQKMMALLCASTTPANGQTTQYDADAGFGIVNYQKAREIYATLDDYVVGGNTRFETEVYRSSNIRLDYGDTLKITSFYGQPICETEDDAVFSFLQTQLYIVDRNTGLEYPLETNQYNYNYSCSFTNNTNTSSNPSRLFQIKLRLKANSFLNYDSYGAIVYSVVKENEIHESNYSFTIRDNQITGLVTEEGFDGVVYIPDNIVKIENSAFSGNNDIRYIICSSTSNLATIGNYAFSFCENLQTIILPKSVFTIGFGMVLYSNNVKIFTSLETKKIGWDETWNVINVNYQAYEDPNIPFYSFAPVEFGVIC